MTATTEAPVSTCFRDKRTELISLPGPEHEFIHLTGAGEWHRGDGETEPCIRIHLAEALSLCDPAVAAQDTVYRAHVDRLEEELRYLDDPDERRADAIRTLVSDLAEIAAPALRTVEQVGERLGVHSATVLRNVRRGLMVRPVAAHGEGTGRRPLWAAAQVERYIDQRQRVPAGVRQ